MAAPAEGGNKRLERRQEYQILQAERVQAHGSYEIDKQGRSQDLSFLRRARRCLVELKLTTLISLKYIAICLTEDLQTIRKDG